MLPLGVAAGFSGGVIDHVPVGAFVPVDADRSSQTPWERMKARQMKNHRIDAAHHSETRVICLGHIIQASGNFNNCKDYVGTRRRSTQPSHDL